MASFNTTDSFGFTEVPSWDFSTIDGFFSFSTLVGPSLAAADNVAFGDTSSDTFVPTSEAFAFGDTVTLTSVVWPTMADVGVLVEQITTIALTFSGDTISLADQATQVMTGNPAESVGFADVATLVFPSTLADRIVAADTFGPMAAALTGAEAATLNDTPSLSFLPSVSDAGTLAENPSYPTVTNSISDSSGVTMTVTLANLDDSSGVDTGVVVMTGTLVSGMSSADVGALVDQGTLAAIVSAGSDAGVLGETPTLTSAISPGDAALLAEVTLVVVSGADTWQFADTVQVTQLGADMVVLGEVLTLDCLLRVDDAAGVRQSSLSHGSQLNVNVVVAEQVTVLVEV